MENRKIRVAITHRDTNGIGHEPIFNTFAEPEMLELCTPIIYGSPKVAAYHRNALGIQAGFTIISNAAEAKDDKLYLVSTFDEDVKVELGKGSDESEKAALDALDRAMEDCRQGLVDVIVLGPADGKNIKSGNLDLPGHFGYVEKGLGDGKKGMRIMVSSQIRVALVTDGMPLRDVSAAITPDSLETSIRTLHNALKSDFRVSSPRIAVLALNPQNGKNGTEEQEVIVPAIEKMAEEGINAFGPYNADTFFGNGSHYAFDAVLAMYHDQGIAPVTALASDSVVNHISGLSVVVAAGDMNPHFEMAGSGKADEESFRHAIYDAVDAFRNRTDYFAPLENPLPKLFHEKRDDSEKVRFAIPKKHENAIKERS